MMKLAIGLLILVQMDSARLVDGFQDIMKGWDKNPKGTPFSFGTGADTERDDDHIGMHADTMGYTYYSRRSIENEMPRDGFAIKLHI
jgi:hypothetical protein